MCASGKTKMIEIKSLIEIEQYLDGIKVVIFDLDDTLYNEVDYVKSGYRKIAQFLTSVRNCEEKLFSYFLNRKNAIDELLNAEGIFSQELKDKCLDVYRNQSPEISLSEETIQLLKKLRKNGYILGVITDGRPEGQRAKIKALNLFSYIDEIVITDELGGAEFRKPCPLAFEKMLKSVKEKYDNKIEFNQMCYVGDNIRKDFIACEKKGIKSIWFTNINGIYN